LLLTGVSAHYPSINECYGDLTPVISVGLMIEQCVLPNEDIALNAIMVHAG
jgi:hypothetical protein